jgi:hypothetical protein
MAVMGGKTGLHGPGSVRMYSLEVKRAVSNTGE